MDTKHVDLYFWDGDWQQHRTESTSLFVCHAFHSQGLVRRHARCVQLCVAPTHRYGVIMLAPTAKKMRMPLMSLGFLGLGRRRVDSSLPNSTPPPKKKNSEKTRTPGEPKLVSSLGEAGVLNSPPCFHFFSFLICSSFHFGKKRFSPFLHFSFFGAGVYFSFFLFATAPAQDRTRLHWTAPPPDRPKFRCVSLPPQISFFLLSVEVLTCGRGSAATTPRGRSRPRPKSWRLPGATDSGTC